ncbi:MAG: right-handed parallel beta-helix repeat-containing protein [Planctomycetales bacterium]
MTLARWPNNGEWAQIAGFPADQKQGDDHGGDLGKLPGGFLYSGDRPKNWKDWQHAWVHGYWAWDWANSYERIASLDTTTRHIKTAEPHGLYGFRKGQRIYFLNILEELDQPGEYYVDPTKGLVYFWPPEPLDSSIVLASVLEQPLVQLNNASHVTLQGLTLEATRGMGVVINQGSHDTISGCMVRMIGSQAIQISGGTHHQVIGCDIRDCGDGGASASGGDRQTLTPGHHAILNSHFERQGRWSKCYVPAINFSGVGLRAAHNLIHDHPHCAIQFVGNEHVIEFNEIHHVALESGDVGVIYTGRDWTYRGHQIRHNFIHRIGGVGMGSMGVYMDDCTSSAEITGNIFYQSSRAVMIGGGRDYLVRNNIFVDCKPSIHFDARGMSPAPVWSDMVQKFMRGRLADVPAELYRKRYPRIADLDPYYAKNEGIPPENNRLENNLAMGGTWIETWNTKPDWLKQVNNSVGPDPGFVSTRFERPADFLLRPDAPALKTGFQQIPVEKIGLQQDEHRRILPQD